MVTRIAIEMKRNASLFGLFVSGGVLLRGKRKRTRGVPYVLRNSGLWRPSIVLVVEVEYGAVDGYSSSE